MATLTIMVGLPRSGKSTWIKNNKGNAIIISNDWIREHILNQTYARSINPVVWMISDSAIRLLLAQGKDVIIDGINHLKFVRKEFIDTAKELGAKTCIVWIQTPSSICSHRNALKESHKLPYKNFEKIKEEFEAPQEYEADEIYKC